MFAEKKILCKMGLILDLDRLMYQADMQDLYVLPICGNLCLISIYVNDQSHRPSYSYLS